MPSMAGTWCCKVMLLSFGAAKAPPSFTHPFVYIMLVILMQSIQAANYSPRLRQHASCQPPLPFARFWCFCVGLFLTPMMMCHTSVH